MKRGVTKLSQDWLRKQWNREQKNGPQRRANKTRGAIELRGTCQYEKKAGYF